MTVYHTDHLNIVRLDTLPPRVNSAKLLRWYNLIDDGCCKVQALAGRATPAGDCLSRPPLEVDSVQAVQAGLIDGPDFRFIESTAQIVQESAFF